MATDLQLVRYYLDDLGTPPLVEDEQITSLLEVYGDPRTTAAAIADSLAVRYTRTGSVSIDGLSVRGGDVGRQYALLAARLRRGGYIGLPVVTGISRGAMDLIEDDTDRMEDLFSVGQDIL